MRLIYGSACRMSCILELSEHSRARCVVAGNLGNPTMEKQKGGIGLMLGALVAVAAFAFIVTGGTYGGKKTVDGDEDLPPVATGTTKK
jgi:hypothetical protein